MKAKLTPLASAFGLAAILTVSAFAQEKPAGLSATVRRTLTKEEAKAIAQEGFIFGLPLVYIATQADAQTNVPNPKAGARRSTSSTTTASSPTPRTTRSSG